MKNNEENKKLAGPDALEMLKADHDEVKKLFKEFWPMLDAASPHAAKEALVKRACNALIVHSKLEEEIFYPAVRRALGDDELMNEAKVEHAAADELIKQLLSSLPGDELYDAKFVVLSEQILHHIRLEEGNMFPRAKDSGVDLAALGLQMKERKGELEAELQQEEHITDDINLSGTQAKAALTREGLLP